jgi:hypothetical protein
MASRAFASVSRTALCIFVHYKAASEFLPVRSGATELRVFNVLKVECRQGRSQDIIACNEAKLFLCIFVHYKAGSEFLPVRSGADKPGT